MAQMTKSMAKLIVEREGNYPLTAWEVKQLALAWLAHQEPRTEERELIRDCLHYLNAPPFLPNVLATQKRRLITRLEAVLCTPSPQGAQGDQPNMQREPQHGE